MSEYNEDDISRIVRKANDIVGKETFARLHNELTVDEWNQLNAFLGRNSKFLHCDGFLGFTNELRTGMWTNEGFENK